MADLVQVEGCEIPYTPAADVAVGQVVVLADLFAVATRPIPANKLGAVSTDGVFRLPKATGAVLQGAIVFWDPTGAKATTTSATGVIYAGKASEAAASGDAFVPVKINIGR